ncbi:MAG: YgjV family protein [Clostridia bacterium]|nr:YgjV family protein [Clostridia bacterium]MBQ8642165.1 YgjV family protein [Clostridia bacterium]
MPQMIIGQILGIMATVIAFVSYQCRGQKQLLLLQTISTACNCMSYMFLGASSGFVLNIVCMVRNVLYYIFRSRAGVSTVIGCILAVVMIFLGAMSWQGAVSLLIITALSVNTVFMSLRNPQILRISVLFTCSLILIYNIFVFSIGGILNEGISIVSAVIGIVRFAKAGKTENG